MLSLPLFVNLAFTALPLGAACKTQPQMPLNRKAEQIYDQMPFTTGEHMRLNVRYMGLSAGFLDFHVLAPVAYNNIWHMGFHVLVETGDWYEKIFKAKDEGTAYTLPGFVASQFRLTQSHIPLLGRTYVEDKMLLFDLKECDTLEEYRDPNGKAIKSVHADWEPDATDILGALYKLRTLDYVKNQETRIKVYTSEKNWWLTASREDFVMLTVPAGKFKAVRLKLQTFIGKELQQKGKAWIWIAFEDPKHPLLKIEADIKIGSFIAVLSEFKVGEALTRPPESPSPNFVIQKQ